MYRVRTAVRRDVLEVGLRGGRRPARGGEAAQALRRGELRREEARAGPGYSAPPPPQFPFYPPFLFFRFC